MMYIWISGTMWYVAFTASPRIILLMVAIYGTLFRQAGGDLLPHIPHVPNISLLSPEMYLSSSSSPYQTYLERSSATCSIHSNHHSSGMNISSSSSPYQATPTKVEVVVPRFDGESHPVGHNQLIPPMRHISTHNVSGGILHVNRY